MWWEQYNKILKPTGDHLSGAANKKALNYLRFKDILTLSGHHNVASNMDPDIKPNLMILNQKDPFENLIL